MSLTINGKNVRGFSINNSLFGELTVKIGAKVKFSNQTAKYLKQNNIDAYYNAGKVDQTSGTITKFLDNASLYPGGRANLVCIDDKFFVQKESCTVTF